MRLTSAVVKRLKFLLCSIVGGPLGPCRISRSGSGELGPSGPQYHARRAPVQRIAVVIAVYLANLCPLSASSVSGDRRPADAWLSHQRRRNARGGPRSRPACAWEHARSPISNEKEKAVPVSSNAFNTRHWPVQNRYTGVISGRSAIMGPIAALVST